MADEKGDLIEEYLHRILKANESINLTRISDPEAARILHIEDSLAALPEVLESPDGLYGDLGTGGGFPGVPIAIMTGRPTVLVDSVKKKISVVKAILDELCLSGQILTYDGRIEDLALLRSGEFSVLTARALTQLPSLIELASPLLRKRGRLVCYKAQISNEEISKAVSVEKKLGMKMRSRRSLLLSDGETHREIIVFEKIASSRIKLPRRVGMAQNNPLA